MRTELLSPTGSTPETRNSEGLVIIFSLGLLNIRTSFFSSSVLMVTLSDMGDEKGRG